VSFRDIVRDLRTHTGFQLAKERLQGRDTVANAIENLVPSRPCLEPPNDPNWLRSVNSSQPGRNSLCPCKSGQKYKRCCGRNAPPILSPAKAASYQRPSAAHSTPSGTTHN
jgi:hypothetical protein